ncbi:hypothetical protein ACMGDE_16295 [Parapedobacter sp. DT-150]
MDSNTLFRLGFGWMAALSIVVSSACNPPATTQRTDNASADSTAVPAAVAEAVTSCYLHTRGRDTIMLQLSTRPDTVSGTLSFNNYQIDDSRGTVAGRYHGDTLIVMYDFHAEGTHNIQEEVFLRQGSMLIRGAGDRSKIDFSTGQVFQPVSCR